ncbi:MAG: hypothetical protein OK456_06100 [Thaumarchaeota archaeon]|nr:hypothetical protein [Nitrososphaerota archaeon]
MPEAMTGAVASISGIRGVFNDSLLSADIAGYAANFASLVQSERILLGRDTRSTGDLISRVVTGTLLSRGVSVVDYGILSTPALFRESRRSSAPALMITASHNEPEWNGMKFVIDGRGIVHPELESILDERTSATRKEGKKRVGSTGSISLGPEPAYNGEVEHMAGAASGEGVKVVLDLNGGAAIPHAAPILRAMGCTLTVIGGTPGVFPRRVDPTADPLEVLSRTVKEKGADVGFAFDCDGDRLVLVDSDGRKRSGDYMLTLALQELLPTVEDRSVVVSVDTTQAIDEVVSGLGGKVHRSKVGEANVISAMTEVGARFGGEGSSGGLIDRDFNSCRDSMLAAVTIVRALRTRGRRVFGKVMSYNQVRLKAEIERRRAAVAIRKLQREHPEAQTLDGLKIPISSRSWVLIRPSGTEDVVRVSAEAISEKEAAKIARTYLNAVKKLA